MHVDTPFAQSMHSLSAIIQFVGGFCWILGILHSERKLNEKRNNHFSSSTVQMFDEEGGLMMREMKSEGREGEQNENTQNEGILIESESENMERMEMETRTDTAIQENNNFNAFYHEKTLFQTVFPGLSALCFILNGIWWCDIGIRIYGYNIDITQHIYHYTVLILLQYICYLFLFLAAFSFIARKLDSKLSKCKCCRSTRNWINFPFFLQIPTS